ncbi:hypothetical protein RHCRD62_30189 [Rhodococcus sp. RD6.2]|nr:hypothetical protein RHCRD62_30189 [Rhodococcus sp. RD6.2]
MADRLLFVARRRVLRVRPCPSKVSGFRSRGAESSSGGSAEPGRFGPSATLAKNSLRVIPVELWPAATHFGG